MSLTVTERVVHRERCAQLRGRLHRQRKRCDRTVRRGLHSAPWDGLPYGTGTLVDGPQLDRPGAVTSWARRESTSMMAAIQHTRKWWTTWYRS